ncbi:UNVERIFIED_CONTAM: hypothetical protein GTU68_065644 [Idotea baltica]|nr:hypothetical protein [Idotea baltica]
MLTNMESQLREQGAEDRLDEVLTEIPRVRADLGYIPLVTPTSQIVGTQAVLNVLTGERYKNITAETSGILKGEYGAAPAPFNAELQARVLAGAAVITCRPADLLEAEMAKLSAELEAHASKDNVQLETGERQVDDVLTYALFPQVGLKFLANRNNAEAFEAAPSSKPTEAKSPAQGDQSSRPETYTVTVDGERYVVEVDAGGEISHYESAAVNANASQTDATQAQTGIAEPVTAPLAGTIWKVEVSAGQLVQEGDVLLILEAMKMETQIVAQKSGVITAITIKPGDAVQVGDLLITIA